MFGFQIDSDVEYSDVEDSDVEDSEDEKVEQVEQVEQVEENSLRINHSVIELHGAIKQLLSIEDKELVKIQLKNYCQHQEVFGESRMSFDSVMKVILSISEGSQYIFNSRVKIGMHNLQQPHKKAKCENWHVELLTFCPDNIEASEYKIRCCCLPKCELSRGGHYHTDVSSIARRKLQDIEVKLSETLVLDEDKQEYLYQKFNSLRHVVKVQLFGLSA